MEKFLEADVFKSINKELSRLRFAKVRDPLHFSFSTATSQPLNKFFQSKPLRDFISVIISKKIKKVEGNIYRFCWKDYTLVHDEDDEKPGYDIVLDLNGAWRDSFGGVVAYSDGHGNSNTLGFSPNTLSVIKRSKGIQKFVKYVNNTVGKNKRYLFMGKLKF